MGIASIINGYVTPRTTGKAVVPEDLYNLVAQMTFGDVMYFTSVADRTTKLATLVTLGLGSPPAGAISYLSTLNRHEWWDGTSWVPLQSGAWTTWSPTLGNLTLGNGTVTAKRRLVGKTVDYRFRFLLGTTSAVGTNPTMTLPFAPHADYPQFDEIGVGTMLDAGTATRAAVARLSTGSTVELVHYSSTGVITATTATAPWTWTTSDAISVAGTYEVA